MDLALFALSIVVIVTGITLALQALGLVNAPEILGALAGAISALAWRIRSTRAKNKDDKPAPERAPKILIAFILPAALFATDCTAAQGAVVRASASAYGQCIAAAALECAPALYPIPALALPNPPPRALPKCQHAPKPAGPPPEPATAPPSKEPAP